MNYHELGHKLGAFLKGFEESYCPEDGNVEMGGEAITALSHTSVAIVDGRQKMLWGNVVPTDGLPELFKGEGAPAKHIRGVHPPAGIDHMTLETVDIFRIPGKDKVYKVPFKGFFKIARTQADTTTFDKATVYVNFLEMKLFGTHEELGDITVDLNPEVVSAGNTFPSVNIGSEACRINVAARFHIHNLGVTLYNKTPVQLTNDDVKGIPTIGEGGKANVSALPLYRWDAPLDKLFGYVEELEYQVKRYMTRAEVAKYRAANNYTEFHAS